MKRKHSAGYFSSYDRGLECLLNMWPRIRKLVPDATLDIYYGWGAFDEMHRSNPKLMKWKWEMIRKFHDLKDQGVTEHGRVSHEDLAKAMLGIKVWAYPTEFTEINCITALKAQEAGMVPVVTNVAALKETVLSGLKVEAQDIYTNAKAQTEFIDKVATALKGKVSVKPMADVYWPDIAKKWDKALA